MCDSALLFDPNAQNNLESSYLNIMTPSGGYARTGKDSCGPGVIVGPAPVFAAIGTYTYVGKIGNHIFPLVCQGGFIYDTAALTGDLSTTWGVVIEDAPFMTSGIR